jgi:tetratricopeptide (TPR) repeat protein
MTGREVEPSELVGLVIDGPQSAERKAALEDAVGEKAGTAGWTIAIDCEQPFGVVFSTIRQLWRPVIAVAAEEAPDLLAVYAPEVLAVWPECRTWPALRAPRSLSEIALGGTKRRLHKDSEQLFRIVHGLVSLLLEARTACASIAGRRVVLAADNIDAADRLSLSVLHHLLNRARDSDIFLVAALDSRWFTDPMSDCGPWLWGRGLDNLRFSDMFAHGYRQHAEVLRLLLNFSATRPISALAIAERSLPKGADDPAVVTFMRMIALGADSETARRQTNGEMAAIAERRPTRVALAAVRRNMEPRTREELHRELRLAPPPSEIVEHKIVPAAFHALRAGASEKDLSACLAAIDVGFAFSMNFELMLLCGAELLSATANLPESHPVIIAANLLLGLTECHLERHEPALELFVATYSVAREPIIRAQICFYAGLILTKCLHRDAEGAQWFKKGIDEVEVRAAEDWRAALELGWNKNGLALCLWRANRFDEAKELVGSALDRTQGFDHAQIENLRINLVNNHSVLHETTGDPKGALRIWASLDALNALIPGGRFSKSFYYRSGWLNLCMNDLGHAAEDYVRSFYIAYRYRDLFHMDIISSACGYVALRRQRLEEAEFWYQQNRELRTKLGDHAGVADAWLGLAAVSAVDGNAIEAENRAQVARDLAMCHGFAQVADRAAAFTRAFRGAAVEGDLLTALESIALRRPKMKLTTPFALAHLASPRSRLPAIHLSLTQSYAATANGE